MRKLIYNLKTGLKHTALVVDAEEEEEKEEMVIYW
jgi:hypothetical protein